MTRSRALASSAMVSVEPGAVMNATRALELMSGLFWDLGDDPARRLAAAAA